MGDPCEVCLCRVYSAIRKLLEEHGCECPCDHHPDERSDACEMCLACRIEAAIGKLAQLSIEADKLAQPSIEADKLAQPSIEADGWVTIYDTLL